MPLRSKKDLDDAQERTIDFLYENDNALALCPTGSGKTVIGMTALQELMCDKVIHRPLIIAPLRVAQLVWPYEGEEWEHLQDFELLHMAGAPDAWMRGEGFNDLLYQSRHLYGRRVYAERAAAHAPTPAVEKEKIALAEDLLKEERKINRQLRAQDLPYLPHVTAYENIEWLFNLYEPGKLPFDAIVFDEIGKLKNPRSPRAKLARKHTTALTDKHGIIWGMNATPAPEGLQDLFMQATIASGCRLWGRSFDRWRKKHFYPTDYKGYKWAPHRGAEEEILAELNTIAIKIDSKDLPYQKNIRINPIHIELPPDARELYNTMQKEFVVDVGEEEDIVAFNEAAKSMKLRQITQGFIYDEDGVGHILHREKQHALSDLLDAMNGEPLLIAYEFREDLEMIREVVPGIRHLGHGVSGPAAKKSCDLWNARKLQSFAVHPWSAGHGLNIQYGGSNIGWLFAPWPLEAFQQTNERLDRRGQTQACFGHMITARNTIEDRVGDRLRDKDVTQQDIIAAIKSV